METWALSQGLALELVKTITDETEKVTPQRIKDKIKEFVEHGDLDQLILYFSCHGVNLKYGEYWLAEIDAPVVTVDETQAPQQLFFVKLGKLLHCQKPI